MLSTLLCAKLCLMRFNVHPSGGFARTVIVFGGVVPTLAAAQLATVFLTWNATNENVAATILALLLVTWLVARGWAQVVNRLDGTTQRQT